MSFKLYTPKPEQVAFWKSTARYIACDCGRGSGKTEMSKHKMARAVCTKWGGDEKRLFLYGLPTHGQASAVAWNDFLNIIPGSVISHISASGSYIETIFNNRLYIRGLHNSATAEGVQYTGVIFDEMSDMPPDLMVSLLPAMGHKMRFCYCIGVPKRTGVGAAVYHELCDKWQELSKTNPEYARFHWTSIGIMPPEKIEQAKQILDEKGFKEQYLASWETAAGMVYYSFNKSIHVTDNTPFDPNEPLIIGCDFNVNPMSWVVCQGKLNQNGMLLGTLTVIDEIHVTDSNTPETLDILWSRYGGHKGGYIFFGDAAGRARNTATAVSDYVIIEDDRRYWAPFSDRTACRFPYANPSVLDRVGSVNCLLKNAAGIVRVQINKKCTHLIKDLEWVSYCNGARDIDKSDPTLTHMSDALGYIIHQVAPIGFDVNAHAGLPSFM
jgi:hypothetical protein